jgi:hypothetical protein
MTDRLLLFALEVHGRPFNDSRWAAIRSIRRRNPPPTCSSFFCSELAAEAYQRIGLLPAPPEGRSSNNYIPADFSEVFLERMLPLGRGFRLGAETLLKDFPGSQSRHTLPALPDSRPRNAGPVPSPKSGVNVMPIGDYFASTYSEARERFRAAAADAGAELVLYELPGHRGPGGEPLAIDVATLGPGDAEAAFLLISATHGVEGFCGSGCQVGFFADRLHDALPQETRSILVHGLNPYGFAWLRRVNEDNVDLNRNFRDFAVPPPDSSDYDALHGWLVPEDWDGPNRQAADRALGDHIQRVGFRAVQDVVSRGQYSRPDGLFFGGVRETWSNATFHRLLEEKVSPAVKRLACIDLHTGLGPSGYGEPIYIGPADSARQRALEWYGPELKDASTGRSVSANVTGSLLEALPALLTGAEVTPIALEFGTKPVMEVLTALRGDHWLHAVPGRESALREGIKRGIRDAFYVDTLSWKAAVYGRTTDFVLRAGRGLARG